LALFPLSVRPLTGGEGGGGCLIILCLDFRHGRPVKDGQHPFDQRDNGVPPFHIVGAPCPFRSWSFETVGVRVALALAVVNADKTPDTNECVDEGTNGLAAPNKQLGGVYLVNREPVIGGRMRNAQQAQQQRGGRVVTEGENLVAISRCPRLSPNPIIAGCLIFPRLLGFVESLSVGQRRVAIHVQRPRDVEQGVKIIDVADLTQ
jgi:hypothetical protein